MTLEELEREYRDHRHTGLDTQVINYTDVENTPAATTLPLSIPITASVGDTTTTMGTDDYERIFTYENASHFLLAMGGTNPYQRHDASSDWAALDNIWGMFKVGDYVYVLMQDTGATPDEWQIWRYDVDDLAAGGTICTFSGTAPDLTVDVNLRLACDGTNFYLNYQGGNSTDAWKIAKYTVSGTVFTHDSVITCGSATLGFNQGFAVLANGNIYTIDTTNRNMSKFNSSGTLQYTDDASTLSTAHEHLSNIEDTLYAYSSTSRHYEKMFYT